MYVPTLPTHYASDAKQPRLVAPHQSPPKLPATQLLEYKCPPLPQLDRLPPAFFQQSLLHVGHDHDVLIHREYFSPAPFRSDYQRSPHELAS